MKQLFTLTLLLFTFCCTCVSAQKTSYQVTAGAGITGIEPGKTPGPAVLLELEATRRIGYRFNLLAGVGLQYSNFVDYGSVFYDCPPIINGIKIFRFSTVEKYETRRMDLTARLGISYEIGRFNFSAAAVPALRLDDELTILEVIETASPRPAQQREYTVRPGEKYDRYADLDDGRFGRLDYNNALVLRADAGASYQFNDRFSLGLRGRFGVSKDELTRYEILEICGENNCTETVNPTSRLDMRDIQLVITASYKL